MEVVQRALEVMSCFLENFSNETCMATECIMKKAPCKNDRDSLCSLICILLCVLIYIIFDIGLLLYCVITWNLPFSANQLGFISSGSGMVIIMIIASPLQVIKIHKSVKIWRLEKNLKHTTGISYLNRNGDASLFNSHIDNDQIYQLQLAQFYTDACQSTLQLSLPIIEGVHVMFCLLLHSEFCILVDTLTIVLGFKGFLWMASGQKKPLKFFHRMLKMPGRAQDCLSTINMREVEMRRKKKRIVLVLLRLIFCSLSAGVSLFSCAYLLTTPHCHNIFTFLESNEFSNLHGTANETWSPQEWNLFPLLFLPAVVTGMAITLIAICRCKKFFGNLEMSGKIKNVSEINTITKASGEIVFPRDDISILTQFNVIPGIFQNQCSDPNRLSYPAIYELHNNRFSQGLATNHI